MTWPRRRQAQNVKALAQHKDSVTRVTEFHHASYQMTHDQEGKAPRSRALNGAEGKVGVLEETQKEGRRQAHGSLLVSALPPSPAAGPVHPAGRWDTPTVQRPDLGDNGRQQ